MAHIILVAKGSGGDILPFLRLGGMLKARGHRITLLTHEFCANLVAGAGLDFIALDDAEVFQQTMADQPLLKTPGQMMVFYRRNILPRMLPEYEMIAAACRDGGSVLVAEHNAHLSVQMVVEKLGIPYAAVYLSPSYLTSGLATGELHRLMAAEINASRAEIGLPPVQDWEKWLLLSDQKLALWPDWFAAPEAAWPPNVTPAGFLLNTAAETGPLPAEVQTILETGEPPILITHGTSVSTDTRFFAASLEACQRLGRRALLVTRYREELPEHLPDGANYFSVLPFATLMPNIGAVVHHGGIGTLARALACGVPQIVLAAGLDRPDNAARMQRLGVGEYLPPMHWKGDKVAETLQRVAGSPDIRERCREISLRVQAADAGTAICEAIEQMVPTHHPRARVTENIPSKAERAMKILLIQNSAYIPGRGGEIKCNRSLLEGLAERGHHCRAVVPAVGVQGSQNQAQFLAELERLGVEIAAANPQADVFHLHGVEVHAVKDPAHLRGYVISQISQFEPTWSLVSAGDPGQVLLEATVKTSPGRVVYLAHTTSILPFGPACFYPFPARTELFRQTAGILTTSRYLKEYFERWGELKATALPFPVYGPGPFPRLGQFDQGYVTLINPCSYKGIAIFLALAQALPDVQFAAVPAWGTTEADLEALKQTPNVHLLPAADDIKDILAQTRIMLVPSLIDEAFGLSAVEAMLHGIPAITSNVGGLPEAKLGVPYVLPVQPIERYENRLDERMKPEAVILEQDIQPWLQALNELISDPSHYEQLALASQEAALKFISKVTIDPFETYLQQLEPASGKHLPSPAPSASSSPQLAVNQLSPERLALLARLVNKGEKKEMGKPVAIPRLPRTGSDDLYPLSFAQERLWFLDQLEPGNPAYNAMSAYRMTGILDQAALEKSLNAVMQRHEILRTTFVVKDGQAWQRVAPTMDFKITVVALKEQKRDARLAEALAWMKTEANRSFDLAHGPLICIALLSLSPTEHILLLTLHHIVSDAWSTAVLVQEAVMLYQHFSMGMQIRLAELPIQYVDYAHWQRQWLQGEELERQLDYWKGQLKGAPPYLDLPADHPRPKMSSYRGATFAFTIPSEVIEALKKFSQREGASLFMSLLAAFQVLLYRYSGQSDVVVGTPSASRTRIELERLVGFLANTLVLRSDLSGDPSYRELLQRVRQMVLGAQSHQDMPFEKLVEAIKPERSLNRTPVFQVMFAWQNMPLPVPVLDKLQIEPLDVENTTAKFDLSMSLMDSPDGAQGYLEYSTDLFDPTTIERLLAHFQTLLCSILADPEQSISDLPLLSKAERQQILVKWNQTQAPYPQNQCLHELLQAQVERTPEAVAVVFEGQQLTYRELDERANRLAHYLQKLGVGPEVLVGICAERSLEMVVGLLGALKAGGAYVPLDPGYPKDRLAFMLQEIQTPVLLTQQRLLAELPEHQARTICLDADWPTIAQERAANPPSSASSVGAKNIAYMIYTSGSTGKPKGALNTHRGIVNRLLWMQDQYQLTAEDVVLQKTPFSFDVSVWEFFWPLLTGAQLVIARPEGHKDPAYLVDTIVRHGVTTIHFVPSMLQAFLTTPDIGRCTSLRRVICSGEALSAELHKRFFDSLPVELYNLYGPTEAAVDVTYWRCQPGGDRSIVPIGRPVANTQMYILDHRLQPVPVGVSGELFIGGVQVGRGYYQRPDLTAEKFIRNPFSADPEACIYRTGDLARYLPDGNIEFLGRMDYQVKLRGFRIELGEIDAVLSECANVQEAVVVMREDTPGDKRLAAYLACSQGQPTSEELREFLRKKLPQYMVPSAFVFVEALPHLPNGKIDRRALPTLPESGTGSTGEFEAPRQGTESKLADIWEQVLGVKKVGRDDSFFQLGGHSLAAIQLVNRVRQDFDVDLPLSASFEAQTIADLARRINTLQGDGKTTGASMIPRRPGIEAPLSVSQRAMWDLFHPSPAGQPALPVSQDRAGGFLKGLAAKRKSGVGSNPGSEIRPLVITARITGDLDRQALAESMKLLARRHELLHTRFVVRDGQVLQDTLEDAPLVDLLVVDLSGEADAQLQALIQQETQHSFEPEEGDLWHIALVRLAEQNHVIILALHPLISDQPSARILLRDLAALYKSVLSGEPPCLPELPIQYADYASWEQSSMNQAALQNQLDFWRQNLSGYKPLFPIKKARHGETQRPSRLASHPFVLPQPLACSLRTLSQQSSVPLFLTLAATFQTLLYRTTREEDVALALPIPHRTHEAAEEIIGPFANYLTLRTTFAGQPTFSDLLQQVRNNATPIFSNQDVPFEMVVRELASMRPQPVSIQAMFALEDKPPKAILASGVTFSDADVFGSESNFELGMLFQQDEAELRGRIVYNPTLFDAATITRFVEDYQGLVENVLNAPDRPVSALPLGSQR